MKLGQAVTNLFQSTIQLLHLIRLRVSLGAWRNHWEPSTIGSPNLGTHGHTCQANLQCQSQDGNSLSSTLPKRFKLQVT